MAQEAATAKSQVEIAHREKLRTMSLPTSPPRPPTAAGEAPAGAGGVRTEDGCISTFQVLCRTRCGAGCSCVLAASTRSIMFHHFRWSLCWFSSAARCSRRRYDVVGTSAIVTACARGRACGGVPDQRRRRSLSWCIACEGGRGNCDGLCWVCAVLAWLQLAHRFVRRSARSLPWPSTAARVVLMAR